MNAYPVAIFEDRYGGCYSHGKWIAVASIDAHPEVMVMVRRCLGPWGDDSEAADYWWGEEEERTWLAAGDTPDEALKALQEKQ